MSTKSPLFFLPRKTNCGKYNFDRYDSFTDTQIYIKIITEIMKISVCLVRLRPVLPRATENQNE